MLRKKCCLGAVLSISFVFLGTKGYQKRTVLPFFGAGCTSGILNGDAPEYALFLSGEVWSQGVDSTSRIETEHFIIDRYFVGKHTNDYLTLKGGNPLAKWEKGMNNGYSVQFDENMTERDFVFILCDELIKPYLGAFLDTLPPDVLEDMEMVILKYQFDIHQKYIGCSLKIPGGLFDRYPRLEPLLYQWAEGAKAFDFTRYKVRFRDKEKFGYGELPVVLVYYVNRLNRERRKQSADGSLSR